jgi:ribosomal protein S12 methylthiotransferase
MPTKTLSEPLQDATQATNPVPAGPTRVGFVSLGCPKNLVDSEVMMGLLQQAGAQLVSGA